MSSIEPVEFNLAAEVAANEPAAAEANPRPPVLRDWAFYGMTITQLLGAFNDNLFKQLMLLLAIPLVSVAAVGAQPQQEDSQGLATVVFALPFILFSGVAGYLSDRYPKRRIIIFSKAGEIGVMLLGLLGFLFFETTGYTGLLVVLFLMGMQSAFFGPGKYGILPEMFRTTDLPRVNGAIVMTTFLAIIFGTAFAGLMGKQLIVENEATGMREAGGLWIGSLLCIAIAVLGTLTSLLIRWTRPAMPELTMTAGSWAIPRDTRAMMAGDRPLIGALLASCVFWLVSGLAIPVVNSMGMVQLGKDEALTSLLAAAIGVGIALGAVVAGRLSHGRADFTLVKKGLWGIVFCMLLLSAWLPGGKHLLGYYGSLLVLILMGGAAAFFAIPLQVFLQSRPPEAQKGRMIAVMNQANFSAILLSGLLYEGFNRLVVSLEWPPSVIFLFMALLLVPLAVFFKLDTE